MAFQVGIHFSALTFGFSREVGVVVLSRLIIPAKGLIADGRTAAAWVADDKRAIMREVALTYRRETRAAQAEGAKPPEQHHCAFEAAHATYVDLDPDGSVIVEPDLGQQLIVLGDAGEMLVIGEVPAGE
jgi:hypothetical protein